ncbi:unnamed protein product [Ixodes pacificus]
MARTSSCAAMCLLTVFLVFSQTSSSSVYGRDPSACGLVPDRGLCYASFTLYFFNSETQTCEEFVYGGCGGNANRFGSLEDCQALCVHGRTGDHESDSGAPNANLTPPPPPPEAVLSPTKPALHTRFVGPYRLTHLEVHHRLGEWQQLALRPVYRLPYPFLAK